MKKSTNVLSKIEYIDIIFPQGLYMYLLYGTFLLGFIFKILIVKGSYSFGWFIIVIQFSSMKWAPSLISRFLNQKTIDFYYIFLKWIWNYDFCLEIYTKENECFDKFRTFPDGSDLYLSAFVIVRCSLKVFAFLLERNSVHLTDRCWFENDFLKRKPPGCFLAQDALPYSQYI